MGGINWVDCNRTWNLFWVAMKSSYENDLSVGKSTKMVLAMARRFISTRLSTRSSTLRTSSSSRAKPCARARQLWMTTLHTALIIRQCAGQARWALHASVR